MRGAEEGRTSALATARGRTHLAWCGPLRPGSSRVQTPGTPPEPARSVKRLRLALENYVRRAQASPRPARQSRNGSALPFGSQHAEPRVAAALAAAYAAKPRGPFTCGRRSPSPRSPCTSEGTGYALVAGEVRSRRFPEGRRARRSMKRSLCRGGSLGFSRAMPMFLPRNRSVSRAPRRRSRFDRNRVLPGDRVAV